LCIVITTAAPAPVLVNGQAVPCQGSSQVYSTLAVGGATSYIWTTNIPGATITGNGLTATVNYPNNAFSGNICVAAVGSCGTSAPLCYPVVSGAPGIIGNITGPLNGVCGESNVNYSVGSGANSYVWTLPSGTTGSSSTNSINVNFGGGFTTGNITVTGNFTCGSSTTTIFVSGAPGTPQVPSGGVSSICLTDINQVYSVNATGATSYSWTANNANGITDCVNPPLCSQYTVEGWLPGAGLTVTAFNSCGSSPSFVFPVGCRMMNSTAFETNVFPNPTSGQVTVSINSEFSGKYQIRVTDLSGRTVYQENPVVSEGISSFNIDLSKLNKGLYLVEVKDLNGKSKVTRLSVE
jgi:hypothetical protein